MKTIRNRCAVLLCVLILSLSITGSAQTEVIFHDSLAAAYGLTLEDIYTALSLTVIGDTAYRLLSNGDIYAWQSQQDQYSLYANVPAAPWARVNVEIPFSQQSAVTQRELTESVSQLIPAEDGLYGLNNLSGRIGSIDKNGWHVSDTRLNSAILWPSDAVYPEPLRNAFITEGKLYAYHDLHYSTVEKPQPTLLIFSLSTGACSVTQMPGVITFCRYAPGTLLCLMDSGTETPSLALYEIASGQMSEFEVAVPVSVERKYFEQSYRLHCRIGGLACDAADETIYLASVHALWLSAAGAAFQQAAEDVWQVWDHEGESMTTAEADAWVLPSGGYIFQNGPWYVKP